MVLCAVIGCYNKAVDKGELGGGGGGGARAPPKFITFFFLSDMRAISILISSKEDSEVPTNFR